MASSVTPHAQNPSIDDSKLLLCGIDSLYMSLYVTWQCDWDRLTSRLDSCKTEAQNALSIVDKTAEGRVFRHLPKGKSTNYRYHLAFSEYNLYISKTREATYQPNMYLSINSEAIWRMGVTGVLDVVKNDIECIGGRVDRMLPSRVDFCADFKMPAPLTDEFLSSHKVSRCKGENVFRNGGKLETYYVGSKNAPIQLRIYNKGTEIVKNKKLWFAEIWGTDDLDNIWRVEYQLRRSALNQFRIQTADDLTQNSSGIWTSLTKWFSLRLLDNKKPERRTIHPWWLQVSGAATQFGPAIETKRTFRSDNSTSEEWYVSHIAGYCPAIGVILGEDSLEGAIDSLKPKLLEHWRSRNFEDAVQKKAIELGLPMPSKTIERNRAQRNNTQQQHYYIHASMPRIFKAYKDTGNR